jgi:NAD(P)-dependent dehydrogenase (short-subunit alcohol dehydrogenase family)
MTAKRTILVTGCSSGIGAHCARALHAEGWRVFATVRKPQDIAALEADGLEALQLDYTDESSIRACVAEVLKRTGGTLDALFNNGAYQQPGAIEDMPTEAFRAQFETNFFGWHTLTRLLIPVMRAQGHGRIVQNSSILGRIPLRYRGPYSASKYALEAYSLILDMELKGSGINVCLIEPGPITSKIANNALPFFRANIDRENSPHKDEYIMQALRMEAGGVPSGWRLGPEAVMKVLRHALNSTNPKPHYVVTATAKSGLFLQWILTKRQFYKRMWRRRAV